MLSHDAVNSQLGSKSIGETESHFLWKQDKTCANKLVLIGWNLVLYILSKNPSYSSSIIFHSPIFRPPMRAIFPNSWRRLRYFWTWRGERSMLSLICIALIWGFWEINLYIWRLAFTNSFTTTSPLSFTNSCIKGMEQNKSPYSNQEGWLSATKTSPPHIWQESVICCWIVLGLWFFTCFNVKLKYE